MAAAGGVLVVLFVDGMALDRFDAALDGGDMPHLAELLAESPSWRGSFRGTFPTSTAPSIPETLAGAWSDHLAGMPDHIHALDRREGRLIRYEVEASEWDGGALTLFDRVAGAGGVVMTYFEGWFPGATITVHDELAYLLDIAMLKAREEAVLAYDRRMVDDLRKRLAAARRAPDVLFIRFGAVDIAGHFFGPDSPQYAAAIRATDERIGEVLEILGEQALPDGRNLRDGATFVLFSDHGMEASGHRIDLDAVLRRAGFDPYPTSDPRALVASVLNPEGLRDHDAVAVPDGSNIATIYLRMRGAERRLPWVKKPPPGYARHARTPSGEVDLVEALLATDGVLRVHELAGPDRVVVHGRLGTLEARRRYRPDGSWRLGLFVGGIDPFGDCGRPGAPCCPLDRVDDEACYLDLPTWRARTRDWVRPELPRMLFKPWGAPEARRPDLLVEADEGRGFTAETHGDHGRYEPRLLRVPVVLAGARVRPDAHPDDPRLVDLVPSLLPLFDLPADPPGTRVDGENLGLVGPPVP